MVEVRPDKDDASDVDFVALPTGTKIGRYEVLAVLGQGGFGITYRAFDSQLGREVALKEFLPTSLAVRRHGSTVSPRSTRVFDDFAKGRDRFVAEGRTLATLHRAPGIVRVFDFLEQNGTAYIVMELLGGETLDRWLSRRGRLEPHVVGRILWTLLDGLEQVHDAGFLHRDIKPSNIMLDDQGHPTLIDFGAARAAMAGQTATMTAVFTPGYAAAEQMSAAGQGPWTDIYGLSATLYHAIAGKAPPSSIDRALEDHCEPIARLAGADFPPGLLAGLDAGLAVRASDRPQSIADWRTVFASGDPDKTVVMRPRSSSRVPTTPARTQRGRLSAGSYLAGAALALLLAGGGTYFVTTFRPSSPALSLQDLRTEDLERLLAERRAAEAAAVEKRRLEEEAMRRAEADTAAKRQADANLQQAQQQLEKAEQELLRLRAEIDASRQQARSEADAAAKRAEAEAAQHKAEVEIAALKQAEQDARRKAAIEAETKRKADETLIRAQAERRRAEAEFARKAEEAKAHPAAVAPTSVVSTPAEPPAGSATFDGSYRGTFDQSGMRPGDSGPRGVTLQVVGNSGNGTLSSIVCGNAPIAVRLSPTGDISGNATIFDAACQRLPMSVKGKAGEGRLQLQLSGVGISGAAALTLAGAAPQVAKPIPSSAAAPPPIDTARWVGRVRCNSWSNSGLPVDLSATGGQAATGTADGTVFLMTISGNRYSASIKWTVPNPTRSFSGTFSGTLSGERLSTTTVARPDFKNQWGSLFDDQCSLELAKMRR
ncbi:MAG: protein kinase [Alphaproteobacteria bacterium]|nr:protein kinase [Alphaproteobacteria bacterium]